MYESTKLLQSAGRKPRYASIIIDEGQDFSDNAYRLIRALAGEEHPNDIFMIFSLQYLTEITVISYIKSIQNAHMHF